MTRLVDAAAEPDRPQVGVSSGATGALDIVVVPIEPTQATVQLRGEVDIATAGLVAVALHKQLAQRHRFVRLDLSRLTFLDCTGLRMLVVAHHEFLDADGTLVLTGVGPRTVWLLRTTGLDAALFVADGIGEPRRVRLLSTVSTKAPR